MRQSAAPVRADHRKHYPMGTRASVEIMADTDEPQTKQRGRQFQEIVAEAMTEAHGLVDARLRGAGFTANVRIVDANCEAWFPGDIVEWRE